jgi:hypothetical protein
MLSKIEIVLHGLFKLRVEVPLKLSYRAASIATAASAMISITTTIRILLLLLGEF